MHDPITPRTADAIARLRLDGQVAIFGRRAEHVNAAVKALCREGLDVVGRRANMGRVADAHELAARTVEHFDGIGIIVNNAATHPIFGSLQQATDAAFDKIFSVTLS